ncbi:hypothetical protein [Litorimonas sp.]|uniref:hypothetical protein n=1 Tax=Litorimonas sp. TaxID=1892381 RepID=UPI003A875CB2
MRIRNLLSATAIIALATSAPAFAQDVDLTSESIRIQTDDCAFNACANLSDLNAEDGLAMLKSMAANRSAALAAKAEKADMKNNKAAKKKNNKGRGLAIGQQNNDPQVVFLQFGSADPTFFASQGGQPIAGGVFPDYIYTQADRDFIQERLEADYAEYNFEFTQVQPSLGDFSTIRIGDNDANPIDLATGILFGRADNIDFGNDDRTDSAFADASFWQLLAELDANFGTQNLANFLGLPGPLTLEEVEEVRQIAVVNQSANTAGHELGHILGLRHHDSFGAPGDGLPAARTPGEFIPLGETDQNALETLTHVMASGASAGLALNSPPFVDRFFSERSAVKLAINERTRKIDESVTQRNGGKLTLNKVKGANPLLDGVNAGGKLDIRAALVSGSITELEEADSYFISGDAGDIFNSEIISFSDANVGDFVVTKLTLKLKQSDGSYAEVASNQRTFEGFEPLVFDFTLPEDGEYMIEVSSPDLVPVGRFADGTPAFASLAANGLNSWRTGDYEMLAYVVEGKPGGGK